MTAAEDMFSVTTIDRSNPKRKPVTHAATIGPGLLCGANRPTNEAGLVTWPSISTVNWWPGTDQVDCRECLHAIAAGLLRTLPPSSRRGQAA